MKIALDEKSNIDDLSYTTDYWFVTGAAEMSLLSDQSVVAPNMQWIATIDTVEWVLSYNGAFWRFGTRAAYADDESSGPDSTELTFNINGNIYNLAKGKGARLALITDIPPASTATPQMDSASGSAGGVQTTTYSKSDHSHPSDTSKQDKLSDEQIGYINAVPSKAPLDSPALTGMPTAPTATSSTNTTQIATTAFVHETISGKADKVSGASNGNIAVLNA